TVVSTDSYIHLASKPDADRGVRQHLIIVVLIGLFKRHVVSRCSTRDGEIVPENFENSPHELGAVACECIGENKCKLGVAARFFEGTPESLPRVAHACSDALYFYGYKGTS